MMQWLISRSLRYRLAVVVLAAVLAVTGLKVIQKTPFDVFPEFAPPLVEIQTEAPGLSSSEVESLISVPIENALNGISWLQTLRSKSVQGLSSVVVIFEDGTDLMIGRQLVQERLSRVARVLPKIAHPPVILSPLSATSRVMKIGLSSDKLNQMELTTLSLWTIRPRLMAIQGVANVAVWGQRDRQIQVLIEPDRLNAHTLSFEDVIKAVQDATDLNSGGFIDTPNQRIAVTHVPPVSTPEDLAQIPLAFRNGSSLKIGNVADVVEGSPPAIGNGIINEGPGILLIVEKQPWGNTLEVTHKIEQTLDAMRPALQNIEVDSTIFRPATFIEMSLENLKHALLLGCVFVVLVLVFFLYDWRTALISVITIPISLLTAALILHYRGGTMDTMVLAGLIISLGEVVDDAIIDVENIMRRLRLNQLSDRPVSSFRVVLNASLEVRSAVVFGSLIVIMVLFPVFFLEGLSGSFFRPLASSYILAIMASLIIALTLTPALALFLLPGSAARHPREPFLIASLKKIYRFILPFPVRHPYCAVFFLLVMMVGTAIQIPYLGEQFLPNFKEYDFLMHWVEKPGISIEAMDRITIRASRELRSIPGVRNFGAHIGRAEVADEVVGSNFTELWISLDPKVDYESTVSKIQEVVDGYPGLYRDLLTYLRERVKEVLTGTSASIVVRIYGPDIEELIKKGQEVGRTLKDVAGIADLKVQALKMVPQVKIKFRPQNAALFGLTPGDIRRAVSTIFKGIKVGEIYEDQKIFDVVVWGTPAVRGNVEALRRLVIKTPSGGAVPLREVADVYFAPTPNGITREAASRRIDVTCNIQGNDLAGVVRDIKERLKAVPFAQGYYPEVIGEYAAQEESRNRLLALAVFSLLGIFILLHADFGSTRLALIVLASLPFALIGSILSIFLTGGILSLGSLVGFVTIVGIVARNTIMLVSHYRHLEKEEGQNFGVELVIRGAEERLAPILMTALTTGLALLPLIVGGIRPGQEIEQPMAVVILGGLCTSTFLNLFIMPALYLKFGKRQS